MSLTHTTLKLALPLAISLALTACGGGSSGTGTDKGIGFGTTKTDTSTPETNTDTSDESPNEETPSAQPEVSSLIIYASSRTLFSDADADDATDGSEPVTIYMMAKDKNNIALTGVEFTPAVGAGATLLPGTVSSDGILTTWRLVPDEPRNHSVDVTVSAGDITETLSIDIIGTNIQINGAESISMNKPTTYTVKLKDAKSRGLAQQQVTISSPLINTTLTTDAQGEAQFDIQPTTGGEYEINVTALGTSNTKTINVSPNAFNLTADLSEIPIDTKQRVTLSWTSDGVAQANKIIHLSATRGKITVNDSVTGQVTTDADGNASFDIESPTAGGTVITATDNTTFLSTSLPLEYIATKPHYLNIQADPSLIAALGTSSILAQVNDINDNPVKNQVVIFNLNDTVDGKLSSSKATTDSTGRASVVYTAGNASSSKDGVTVSSYIEGQPSVPLDTTTLTVGGEAVRMAFGFDEKIAEREPFYEKVFGVIVTDNAGNPVSSKQVNFTVSSTKYLKGRLEYIGTQWVPRAPIYECDAEDKDKDGWLDYNEDVNNNAQLDAGEDLDGNGILDISEDFNNSGKLEPTNSTTITGNSVTDESGQAVVKITYLQNHAWWEKVEITAQVTVNGTEYIEKIRDLTLPVLAADIEKESIPPNYISPYGTDVCASKD